MVLFLQKISLCNVCMYVELQTQKEIELPFTDSSSKWSKQPDLSQGKTRSLEQHAHLPHRSQVLGPTSAAFPGPLSGSGHGSMVNVTITRTLTSSTYLGSVRLVHFPTIPALVLFFYEKQQFTQWFVQKLMVTFFKRYIFMKSMICNWLIEIEVIRKHGNVSGWSWS